MSGANRLREPTARHLKPYIIYDESSSPSADDDIIPMEAGLSD
jgi:hypothetical protein